MRSSADETAGDGMNGITEGDIVSLTSDSRRWRVLAIFTDRADRDRRRGVGAQAPSDSRSCTL